MHHLLQHQEFFRQMKSKKKELEKELENLKTTTRQYIFSIHSLQSNLLGEKGLISEIKELEAKLNSESCADKKEDISKELAKRKEEVSNIAKKNIQNMCAETLYEIVTQNTLDVLFETEQISKNIRETDQNLEKIEKISANLFIEQPLQQINSNVNVVAEAKQITDQQQLKTYK